MKSSSFKIEGMSCSACANRVERVVKKMNGVEEASVNFATETLLVKFDDAKIDAPKIEEAIVKAGYSVRKDMRDYTFKVEGMSCSACANRVERITKKIDGVESANVNFATGKGPSDTCSNCGCYCDSVIGIGYNTGSYREIASITDRTSSL